MSKINQRYIVWRINKIRQRAVARNIEKHLRDRAALREFDLGAAVEMGLTLDENNKLSELRYALMRNGGGYFTLEQIYEWNLKDKI